MSHIPSSNDPSGGRCPSQSQEQYRSARARMCEILRKSRDLRSAYACLDITPPRALSEVSEARPHRISAKRLGSLLRGVESGCKDSQVKLRHVLLQTPPLWSSVIADFHQCERVLVEVAAQGIESSSWRLMGQLDAMRRHFGTSGCDPMMRLATANLLLCWLHLLCIGEVGREYDRHSGNVKLWGRRFARAWREIHDAAREYRETGEAIFGVGQNLTQSTERIHGGPCDVPA